MKECTICSSSRSNYKCAKCRVPYCSVTCYTAHKELCSPLQIVVSESAVIADVQGELGILDKHTTAKSSTSLGVFKGNYTSSSSGVQSPEDGILHKIQLTALDEDAEIQILLRSHRLGEHILYIDSAPDRSRALKRLRESHPEFEYFVDKILKTCTASEGKVGVEKNRQHALKEDLKALVKQAE